MSDNTEALLQRVRAIMPDLKIEQIERNHEGTINDILIVNRNLVFRFARAEKYIPLLQAELKILDLVRPHLGLSVPTPVYTSSDCIVYPLLGGQTLSRKLVLGFDESVRNDLAAQIGAFLYRLHNLEISDLDWEIPPTRARVKRSSWLEVKESVKARLYPLLQNYQIEWVEDLLNTALEDPDFFEYKPALIHGDLASYHFLFDEQEHKITGVIDFGMAGIGDPASDIGILISIYGESFVRKLQKSYPDLEKCLPRARFYAQGLELEWTLLGLETGETFWFTAHLAGARDIQA
jgi:aminoglycoside 2''-phosphotransferase